VPNGNQGQLTIWGRPNSVNVQKVLWCLRELELSYERIDAGMHYLCLAYGDGSPIYPHEPKRRAAVDRWLDWTLSTVQPVDRPVFWALVRTPVEQRDMVAIQKDADAEAEVWRVVDRQLATRRFIEGDEFTLADIALGAYARRWLGVEGIARPELTELNRWFAQFSKRPGFTEFVAPPMS
jgi:glutathione S-transferase